MGNYRNTITYRQAAEIYQLTKEFTKKYLHPIRDSRLIDQMNSSARSMKQNQAEGALRNSLKALIEFLGFARASGEELLEDYLDLAREWKIPISRPSFLSSSSLSSKSSKSSLSSDLNFLIDLVTRTNYLLDRQRRALEKHFIEHGGHSENLAEKRRKIRGY